MNDNAIPTLTDQVSAPAKLEFPWPELRDFVSCNISLMLAQQNCMIGEQMIERETNPAAREVAVQQLERVRAMRDNLNAQVQALNAKIEVKLAALESKGPRLILPH